MNESTYLFAITAAASGSRCVTLMVMMKLAREGTADIEPMSIPMLAGSVPGGARLMAARFRISCSSGLRDDLTSAASMPLRSTSRWVFMSTSDLTDVSTTP